MKTETELRNAIKELEKYALKISEEFTATLIHKKDEEFDNRERMFKLDLRDTFVKINSLRWQLE